MSVQKYIEVFLVTDNYFMRILDFENKFSKIHIFLLVHTKIVFLRVLFLKSCA